jgi:bifunctional DNase/RNase
VVLLKERAGERILPIWVGAVEGDHLAMQLTEIVTPRPMHYDLMARLLEVTEVRVEKVAVTSLRDNTFYATIWVRVGDRLREVDARPSDAFNLALRAKAPIFVTPEVFAQNRVQPTREEVPPGSGYVFHRADGRQIRSQGVLELLEECHRKLLEEKAEPPETPEMEWRSFRSLPRGDAGGWLKPTVK